MIKSILLGMDGSEHAWSAWRYALDLARVYRAWLRALAVVDTRVLAEQTRAAHGGFYPSPLGPEYGRAEDAETKLNELLEEVRRKTEAAGVRAQVMLSRGDPAPTIWSHDPLVDLIAIGHRGDRGGWDRFTMGSVAVGVVRHSSRPVLVAPTEYKPIQRLLVAYDGSESSKHALTWAADLAGTMKLPLEVVHVNDNSALGVMTVREANAYFKPYGLSEVNTIVREGEVAQQILAVAGERGAGLIIMGAYGHSRLREMILGSVTEEVLRQAETPLLLTR